MIYNINEINYKIKEDINKKHNIWSEILKGFGFQIICNCEYHRKLVLDKAILKNDSNNENPIVGELNIKGEFNK